MRTKIKLAISLILLILVIGIVNAETVGNVTINTGMANNVTTNTGNVSIVSPIATPIRPTVSTGSTGSSSSGTGPEWCKVGTSITSSSPKGVGSFIIKGMTIYQGKEVCESEWTNTDGTMIQYFNIDSTFTATVMKDKTGNIIQEFNYNVQTPKQTPIRPIVTATPIVTPIRPTATAIPIRQTVTARPEPIITETPIRPTVIATPTVIQINTTVATTTPVVIEKYGIVYDNINLKHTISLCSPVPIDNYRWRMIDTYNCGYTYSLSNYPLNNLPSGGDSMRVSNSEMVMAQISIWDDSTSPGKITYTWYQKADKASDKDKQLYQKILDVPACGGGFGFVLFGECAIFTVANPAIFIGHFSWEIDRPGTYYVVVDTTWGSETINFQVTK